MPGEVPVTGTFPGEATIVIAVEAPFHRCSRRRSYLSKERISGRRTSAPCSARFLPVSTEPLPRLVLRQRMTKTPRSRIVVTGMTGTVRRHGHHLFPRGFATK